MSELTAVKKRSGRTVTSTKDELLKQPKPDMTEADSDRLSDPEKQNRKVSWTLPLSPLKN